MYRGQKITHENIGLNKNKTSGRKKTDFNYKHQVMSKSVRAQRSGAYLQEAVISIFVAGTMELSGSKSPIVAMAEAIFYLFSLNQLFSVPEVRTFITALTFLWLCVCVPSNRECESAASGSSSCCCRWSASG